MVSEKYILKKFEKCSLQEQVDILLKALDYMKADNRRNQADCIALAMGIPLFPKVIAVEDVDDYKVLLTFNNGENRLIDFRQFFSPEKKFEKLLLCNEKQFKAMQVLEGTLAWPDLGIRSTDVNGAQTFFHFDIDPGLLYESAVELVA